MESGIDQTGVKTKFMHRKMLNPLDESESNLKVLSKICDPI